MFEVKFATPKPVLFREYRKFGDQVMDVDLEARFAGKCEVSGYDKSRYADEGEVSEYIKSNCSAILEKCLKSRPEGESVMKSFFAGLDGAFSAELENSGISAKTEIFAKNLTEDSEQVYKDLLKVFTATRTDFGWDHVNFDTVIKKPEGTFMVSPASMSLKYKDNRVFYKPGEHVEAIYWAVASDTSYQVTVDAPDLKVEYGSVITISFTMPEHDVYISVGAQSYMTCMPPNARMMNFPGMMMNMGNMGNPTEAPKPDPGEKPAVSGVSEWTCPLCGTVNKGKFCYECGGARPADTVAGCGNM